MDLPLECLVAVESLLLLKEEDVGGQRKTSDSLAVSWIRPRNTIIVGMVRSIVHTLARLLDAGDFARRNSRAFIGSLE